MWIESWQYHPMGLLILALFVFTAAQSLIPRAYRVRLAEFMQGRALFFNAVYLGFVMVFVGFGALRAAVHWLSALR
jgi:hypothetical protein